MPEDTRGRAGAASDRAAELAREIFEAGRESILMEEEWEPILLQYQNRVRRLVEQAEPPSRDKSSIRFSGEPESRSTGLGAIMPDLEAEIEERKGGVMLETEIRDLNAPEPAPEVSEGDTWLLVIEDMRERRLGGIRKYGTPLQPGNGRYSLKDAYQEALDLTVYLRNELEERSPAPESRAPCCPTCGSANPQIHRGVHGGPAWAQCRDPWHGGVNGAALAFGGAYCREPTFASRPTELFDLRTNQIVAPRENRHSGPAPVESGAAAVERAVFGRGRGY